MIYKLDNPIETCELKLDDGVEGGIKGYASVFNGNDSVNDTIEPGAFEKTLKTRKRSPLMLYGHNPGRVIGKWSELKEDDNGLIASGQFTPGNTDAQDVRASVRFGAIDGLSIGFRIPQGGAEKKEDGGRIIKQVDLVEISVVSFPADSDARIAIAKEEILEIKSIRDAEYLLRDSGVFSRSMANAFVSQFKSVCLSDSGDEAREQITELKARIMEYEKRLRVQTGTDYLVQAIRNL